MAKTQKIIGIPPSTIELLNSGTITHDQVFNVKDFGIGDAVYFWTDNTHGYIKTIVKEINGKKKFDTPFIAGSSNVTEVLEGDTNVSDLQILGNGCIIECENIPESVTGLGNIPDEDITYTIPANSKLLLGLYKTITDDLNNSNDIEIKNISIGDNIQSHGKIYTVRNIDGINKLGTIVSTPTEIILGGKPMIVNQQEWKPQCIIQFNAGFWYLTSDNEVTITFKKPEA